MAVYSMTGFASAQQGVGKGSSGTDSRGSAAVQLGLEIRSVNSRFLDLSFRLPEELRQHEPLLREALGKHLRRGKVEVRASLDAVVPDSVAEPSPRLLQRLGALQESVRGWLPDARALGVADVLRLAAAGDATVGEYGEELAALAKALLKDLLAAREREGARLAAMLIGHIAQLKKLATAAGPMMPLLVEQQRKRFLERWQDAMALADGPVPESAHERALSEATAFAIRVDVAEELTRLQAHLEEIESLIAKGGEIGKRLDFLIQELHREANTLGSKSPALELTRVAVDMKVLIEQMREQVQNIE
jgi:uncharacterized protein (TIGR00255 family)